MLSEYLLHIINSDYKYSGIVFITVSAVCFIVTTIQFRLEKDEKDLRLYFVTHSFLTLSECTVIFVFKGRYLEHYVDEKAFICLIWVLHSLLRIFSFMLFWVQRKLFYRRTALVNNCTRKLEIFENGIAFLSIFSDVFKCGANITLIIKSNWLIDSNNCDVKTKEMWSHFFMYLFHFLRVALFVVMLEPVVSHWNRLTTSRQTGFSFRMKVKVIQPALLSFLYLCANAINHINLGLFIDHQCEYLFGRLLTFSQFAPVFYIISVIVPWDKILQCVCQCRCNDEDYTVSA